MFVCVRFLNRNLSRYCAMKFAEYMETFGAVPNTFQGLSNTRLHIKRGKNGVKREPQPQLSFKGKYRVSKAVSTAPVYGKNLEVLKSLLK